MDIQTQVYAVAGTLGAAAALALTLAGVLWCRVRALRRAVAELQAGCRLRVQKLKMEPDKNHAFRQPTLAPGEELSQRGYTMFTGDLEAGRERQTGGGGGRLVEELTRELDSRQQRQSAPPFLLQAIDDNKRRSQTLPQTQAQGLSNPAARARASDTNPNFIY